ncbi:hypothetical protein IPZ58_27840 [Streptomyces roseoverticillatus]|uniref:hypothetical protein n=1 Tax=Streptomyces roseoverticillatus TaxID=66429 RepID=UPI001F35DAE5|nr:hypothetical protein [Streptomyces roseoverticillatus]MCF3105374.1 hypothetical protein [Streptomyces roseoverticillatus]
MDGEKGRAPRTTWEYAVSAADQLVLWHADSNPGIGKQPLRHQAVVLLGAAIYQWASDERQHGPGVADAPLGLLINLLRDQAVSALERCPATADCGAEERALLVHAYGGPAFDVVQHTALDVVQHHLNDAGPATTVTIADRRPALQEAARRRTANSVQDDEGF